MVVVLVAVLVAVVLVVGGNCKKQIPTPPLLEKPSLLSNTKKEVKDK